MKIYRYSIISIFAFVFLALLWGCLNPSYTAKAITRISAYPKAIERAKRNHRNLIMHSGVDVYKIASVEIDKAKHQFTVQLDKPDSFLLVSNKETQVIANNKKSLSSALSAIHMYMRDSTSYTLDEPHTILLNKIARIE